MIAALVILAIVCIVGIGICLAGILASYRREGWL